MKNTPKFLASSTLALLLVYGCGAASHERTIFLSLDDAKEVADFLSRDANYSGEIFVPLAIQNDRNFYAFEIVQNSEGAANLQMIDLNVNRFTGDVWFVIGSECSTYTSAVLRKRQEEIRRRVGLIGKPYVLLRALKPIDFARDQAAKKEKFEETEAEFPKNPSASINSSQACIIESKKALLWIQMSRAASRDHRRLIKRKRPIQIRMQVSAIISCWQNAAAFGCASWSKHSASSENATTGSYGFAVAKCPADSGYRDHHANYYFFSLHVSDGQLADFSSIIENGRSWVWKILGGQERRDIWREIRCKPRSAIV